MKTASHALIVLLLLAAAGCGLKGPLRLPDSDSSQATGQEEDPKTAKKNRSNESTTAPVVDPATPPAPPLER